MSIQIGILYRRVPTKSFPMPVILSVTAAISLAD